MLIFESRDASRLGGSLTRRDFVRLGALTAASAGLPRTALAAGQAVPPGDTNCIVLFLVGGPSHLDTFDLKPDAPDTVRGPFRPVQTNVPGLQICEHLPLMARMADRFALVRSVHHQTAPVHETGQQLMQTGRLSSLEIEQPHYGAVVSRVLGRRRAGVPAFALVPGPIGNTGISVSHGQGAGFLGADHEPAYRSNQRGFDLSAEPRNIQDRYGRNDFGRSCLSARRLVEGGVRLVTVNMFDTVYGKTTWDCHADGVLLNSTLEDYRTTLCPMFDRAYSALLQDLHDRGLLQTTLVVAMGEFGRTPYLNARGGRDHWPGVWSILFAGGGVRGGQVIGASDRIGAEPRQRPVSPAEVAATVYHGLGIDSRARLPGPRGQELPIADAKPIGELFGG